MRRVTSILLSAILAFSLCACGGKTSAWQEQYDIAVRYLSDGNYEEAIIAFTSAIKIDPKQASAYIGRADTYVEKGSIEDLLLAIEDYDTAIALEPTQWESYQKKNAVLTTMGDYVDGLATLYKYKEASPSQEADEAIQSYLERLSFDIEIEEPTQQPKATFADTGVIEAGATGEKVVYLVLTDAQTGVKQVAASLAIKFDTDLGFDETSIEIVKNHEDVWLFYLWTGVGMTSTFLYTIHTNQILVLEPGLTKWNSTDDYLIGETITFAAGDKEEAYFYDWSGNLLYKLEDIVGSCILDGNSLYYADCVNEGKKQVYHVWTMALGEYMASTVCTVELHNGYLYLGDGKILDRFGVTRVGHTADAVRPHTLIRDAVLRRFFFLIRSVRSCDGGFDLFSFGAGQLFLFGQFDTPPGLTGFAAPERHKNCWSYTDAASASGSTRGRCCG